MIQTKFILLGIALVVAIYFVSTKTKENYRDPIFMNKRKLMYDWYPRANGSIYGFSSHVLSGFPYYDKAY